MTKMTQMTHLRQRFSQGQTQRARAIWGGLGEARTEHSCSAYALLDRGTGDFTKRDSGLVRCPVSGVRCSRIVECSVAWGEPGLDRGSLGAMAMAIACACPHPAFGHPLPGRARE